jgi:hypothetical protein
MFPRRHAGSGRLAFVYHPGDPWEVAWCVRAGSTITIGLGPARGYRWSAVSSSGVRLAEVTATSTDPSGAAHAGVSVRGVGDAVLSAATWFTPDPHGPPTRLWRLALHIVASDTDPALIRVWPGTEITGSPPDIGRSRSGYRA